MNDTDPRPARRNQRAVDARWALTSSVLTALQRSARAPASVVPAVFDTGIRLEGAAQRLRELVDRSTRPRRALPNVHEGGRRDGPGVILVNGWTASGLAWPAALVAALERNFHVLRIDNRGTGWSGHMARPFTIGDLADDVRNVIDDRGLDRPIVVGLSMGGMITQELAIRAPDHLGHAVLLGTRPPSPAHTAPPAFVTAQLMTPPRPGQSLDEFMRLRWQSVTGTDFALEHPEAMAEVVQSFVQRPTVRGAVLDQARAVAAWCGAERLRSIRVATTIVHGTDDPLIPVRNGMRLAQLIPGARYVELPGVGHLVPHEATAVVVGIVEEVATIAGSLVRARE